MKIAAVACQNYNKRVLENKVREALELIGGIEEFISPGDNVLLKPNMLSPHAPELGITTHPALVRAVIKLIQEAGGEVKVGESSGGMLVNQSLTDKSFQETGIAAVCQELGAEMINFDRVETELISNPGSMANQFPLPKPLLEADVIISLPKLKTHSLTLFTGAIKNLYGCIPGMKKAEYHKLYPHPEDFANLVVDIFSLVKPDLAIMDGIIGLEGNGPGATGTPCQIGTILAGEDLVALDTVAASYLGYKENQVPITRIAQERRLGINNLSTIEIVGNFTIEQQDYKLPSNAILSWLPRWILEPIFNSLLSKPEINQQECISCQRCVYSCPQDVIIEDKDGLIIQDEDCIKCLCCQELCPQKAVEVREHPIVKLIRSIKDTLS